MEKVRSREKALEYVAANKLLTLATVEDQTPWAVTAFYACNKDFHLFFFSNPETKHCQDILKNPNVAVTINQEQEKGEVRGVQLVGVAKEVEEANYETAYQLYHARYPWADNYPDHTLYEITPTALYYLDSELLGNHFKIQII